METGIPEEEFVLRFALHEDKLRSNFLGDDLIAIGNVLNETIFIRADTWTRFFQLLLNCQFI